MSTPDNKRPALQHQSISNKSLVSTSSTTSVSDVNVETTPQNDAVNISLTRRYITVALLFVVNLLNYMDRYTLAGVLKDVKDHFVIEDDGAGLLQSIFVVGFMVTAPAFGYAGDRYNRKWLMVGGILFWSLVTLAGSFVPPGNGNFWAFVLLRAFVGIGEASYTTIAPTIISDLFVNEKRSNMIMIFNFAIPVGSGLGYIVGSSVAAAFGDWEWALRVTPVFGIICCLLLTFITQDPPRGMAEAGAEGHSTASYKEDMLALVRNKTFILSTMGNSCVTFVAGALALFAPSFMLDASHVSGDVAATQENVSLYMGVITTAAGFIGVAIGRLVASFVKRKHKNGDPLVCAAGLLIGTPALFGALVICEYNMIIAWVLVMLGETLVFMNWPLVLDMLMYTVPATKRATAAAMQIFISHLLGDAASPLLLGVISTALLGNKTGLYNGFKALQSSLYVTLFVSVLGGAFFLFCSIFINKDRVLAEKATQGVPPPVTESNGALELTTSPRHSTSEKLSSE